MGLVIAVRGGKEKVQVGACTISIAAIDGNSVLLHFEAPREIQIDRITGEYQWKGKNKKKKLSQKNEGDYSAEKRRERLLSGSTQENSSLLKKNLAHSKSSSTVQSGILGNIEDTGSKCFLCYPTKCKCKF